MTMRPMTPQALTPGYRDILLIGDPSRLQSPAFRRARRLAQDSGARLHVEVFDYRSAIATAGLLNPELGARARRELTEERRRWLDARVRELRDLGIDARTALTWGGPVHEHIVARVMRRAPDLVVKDVALVAPLQERLLLTPLDWQLLRLCPVPLLLVNASAQELPGRVIAALDPVSPGGPGLDERVLDAATALAHACQAALHAAHAFEGVATPAPTRTAPADLREMHRERFERIALRRGIAPGCRHFLEGPPESVLPGLAVDPGADVLVLATLSRAGRERINVGSTLERLMERLGCDVLAVKPEGFAADLQRKFPAIAAAARPPLRAVK